ncbi:MAG: bifunctional 23S rRNA (guanine(2069)-N(7))-methyltransferase RlmK/23S rRNA (guanine(2445)-N(2))-methyltransferase RlmL [Halioglobus sp.]
MSQQSESLAWFASCPKGIESLLLDELASLGAQSVRETVAGVHFEGPWATAYRACLWTRLANRILWPVCQVAAEDGDAMYAGLRTVKWGDYFCAQDSIAIDFSGENRSIRNTQFGAQRSKDAIVDWFATAEGERPSVDRARPDVRINIRLVRGTAYVAFDLGGGSLHQRGYRQSTGAAPMKENVAAAVLLRADWPGMAARGGALIDPMCGGATLLLEGAMMAADIAPGLERKRFGFEALNQHDWRQWQAITADARGRAERGRAATLPEIRGYDADPRVVRRAQENIARLDLSRAVRVSVKPVRELTKPSHKPLPHGLIVCNPPYGERLGEKATLMPVYRDLGKAIATEFQGWHAAVLTSELDLGKAIGLRSHKRYALFNGALATSLLLFDLVDNTFRDTVGEVSSQAGGATKTDSAAEVLELSDGAVMFANRIKKNQKRLKSWLRKEQVECYRLYDADMPEYAVAIDIYGQSAHVAEYRAPKGVSVDAAQRRLDEIKAVLPAALDIPAHDIAFKQRSRQKGAEQYRKQASRGELRKVREGQAHLLINLHDYLDTGLFLDHRPLRLRLHAESEGKDFLNLYCYTGSATVHSALGGARSTTSVDTSNTYLEWLRKNLAQNGLGLDNHSIVKADCQRWLGETQEMFDLILLDPPSFSNSKSREESFDVQRDHVALIQSAMARLRPKGVLYFSNNRRDFSLDGALAEEFDCTDITEQTLDSDFARNKRIHCCWRMTHQ